MKVNIVFFYIFFGIISCKKDENTSPIYDVVLIIGQSNNYFGDSLGLLIPLNVSDNIKQLGRYGSNNLKIIPASESLEHHSYQSEKGGYALTFSILYEDVLLEKNHKVLLVPCARWGSSFIENNWNKNNKYYNDAVERTMFILSKYPKSKLKAILWHQGESDVENPNYKMNLDSFIKNIKKDTKSNEIPFILGGMVPFWAKQNKNRIEIQNIIKDTPFRINHTGYANPNFPYIIEKYNNAIDSVHYNAKGLRELGQRYFIQYQKLKK